jgi:hypothetical protein
VKIKSIVTILLIIAFLGTMTFIPVNAAKVTRIPFTVTVYAVSFTPGDLWYSDNGKITHTANSYFTAVSIDGKLISQTNEIMSVYNSVTQQGRTESKFVDTYTDSIIGTGVIEGVSRGQMGDQFGMSGTGSITASGSTDLYHHITEISTVSWQSVSIGPYTTIATTVTGVYIIEP